MSVCHSVCTQLKGSVPEAEKFLEIGKDVERPWHGELQRKLSRLGVVADGMLRIIPGG